MNGYSGVRRKGRHLAQGMYAGIGSAREGRSMRALRKRLNGILQRLLYARGFGLALSTVKTRTIVLEPQSYAALHHAS